MATGKAWYQCWWSDDKEDEVNILRNELDDSRSKLEEARKEIRRLQFENVSLLNGGKPTFSTQSSLNNVNELPHVTRPVPNFDYSSGTMIIHPEYTSKQTSALEKLEEKVMEKLQKKNENANANELQYELLSDNEEYEDQQQSEYERHREKVGELMKQIDRLSKIIQQKDIDHKSIMKEKDESIAALEKQLRRLKAEKDKKYQSPAASASNLMKSVSFSMSMNQMITDDDDDNMSQKSLRSQSSQTSKSNTRTVNKRSHKNRYDSTKEQIDILNNSSLKQKSLVLCREQVAFNKSGKDKGLLLFFQKYVKSKTLDSLFTKSGKATKSDTGRISNATGLVNVLSFAVILYKVKVFQTEKGYNQKPEINNAEVKSSVKYLALWIVRTHGEKTRNTYYHNKTEKEYAVYNFKMTKDGFEKNMPRYIQQFVQNEGKHMDSDL